MNANPGSRAYERFTDRLVAYTMLLCGGALFVIAICLTY